MIMKQVGLVTSDSALGWNPALETAEMWWDPHAALMLAAELSR